MVKFAHLADCHVGGWREPVLRELNHQAFVTAIDQCISERVDFVIIAGDLFNTAFPAVESLALVTRKLKHLKDSNIPVYAIPGSHDFSPSGACMLDVLEEAGLLTHVCRGSLVDGKLKLSFVTDQRTGVKLTGLIGKKGALDKEYYELLDREFLERESGYKIFVFHCAIAELKPIDLQTMDAMPASLLPKGFNYYAGGHVHVVDNKSLDSHQNIVFPGPTFPNNFAELEKLNQGSFCIVDRWNVRVVPVQVAPVVCVQINASNKTPFEVEQELQAELNKIQDNSCILLIRVFGVLKEDGPSDIHWERILEAYPARAILRNTNALSSKEFEDISLSQQPIESMEKTLIAQQTGTIILKDKDSDAILVEHLMSAFDTERHEGEKVTDVETRIIKSAESVLQECLKTNTTS